MTNNSRPTGRLRKLTEQDIIDAALAEGFAGITVPAVGRRLGVSTVTLYRYTRNRADLLALAWNHDINTTPWPAPTGTWREGDRFIDLDGRAPAGDRPGSSRRDLVRSVRASGACWASDPPHARHVGSGLVTVMHPRGSRMVAAIRDQPV